MKKQIIKIVLFSLLGLAVVGGVITTVILVKNNKKVDETTYNNEEDPLVFSTAEVDKVFNPFFSTSATDGNVVGMTQIGMLGNDKNGKVVYGDSEGVVTKDLEIVTTGTEGVDQITTYYFVLKNNVKFSNGSALTMKDVLFNLYVYLDPAYTGSSTIYSTDIVGLKEYRTQEANEKEQDSFKLKFETEANTRIDALVSAVEEIYDDHKGEAITNESLIGYLEEYAQIKAYEHVVDDYKKACELFKEELESDYSNSLDSYDSLKFYDKLGKEYKPFTTDVEVFLYNEGLISWDKENGKIKESVTGYKAWTKEEAINVVYNQNIPDKVSTVVQYWNTSVTLYDFIVNEAMEKHFAGVTTLTYPNISGIQFANKDEAVTVNGVTYNVPKYNEDGSVKDGYEVLSIAIHDVDPKAIWNFSFAVAPMYYYSDEKHIAAFDYVSNFGVEYASQTFMNNVVKDPEKVGVPVGAGPYAASKSDGGIENITAGDFYHLGVIYFERNPYFVMGEAKIKKIRFTVVANAQMLNSLYNHEIDYVEPNAKPNTISELNEKAKDGIGNKSIQTSGYGYIGINAGKVPDMAVRQAIMHAINTQECVDYYKTTAKAIYRSMSMSSWAYPDGCTSYYPYVGSPIPADLTVVNPAYRKFVSEHGYKSGDVMSEADQLLFLTELVESAGYTLNGDGIYQKGNHKLEYKFTIAGEETDHPAWQAMNHAREVLNKVHFNITVTTDQNALKKLSTGDLTVWAAAWGSTIDPDMYQVYHKDSTATSVLNWGYKQIKQNIGGKYDAELAIIEELSEIIDAARKINDEKQRAALYSDALDLVMQLAVELPTYQRDDLFAYNANKIDVNSLTPDNELSPYKGLTSDLYLVSLNEEK